ncbi:MAG: tetratricopeptide repeat protein [Acidobacteriota bacterium]|nr:tetratricopeptide repeat protein [Acidobacteriota bacterium]
MNLMEQAQAKVDAADLSSALRLMEEARELRPSDEVVLFRLASLHYDLKHYDLARNYAQEAISLAPTQWLYHYLLGRIEGSAGRWREARTSLEAAIRMNPSATEAHNALAEITLREK